LRKWKTMSELINAIKAFENKIYGRFGSPETVLVELIRIAHRQFIWQAKPPNSTTTIRYFKIFNRPAIDAICPVTREPTPREAMTREAMLRPPPVPVERQRLESLIEDAGAPPLLPTPPPDAGPAFYPLPVPPSFELAPHAPPVPPPSESVFQIPPPPEPKRMLAPPRPQRANGLGRVLPQARGANPQERSRDRARGGTLLLLGAAGGVQPRGAGFPGAPFQVTPGTDAEQRSPILPNVPTSQEAGLPEFQVLSWLDAVSPRHGCSTVATDCGLHVPRNIVKRLSGYHALSYALQNWECVPYHSWKNWSAPGSNLSLVMATPGARRRNGCTVRSVTTASRGSARRRSWMPSRCHNGTGVPVRTVEWRS
jgi:hypothetical protein